MTFLELCKQARQEARITGTGPAQVTNQTGVLAEVVSAVRDAWLDIQAMHETWSFMVKVNHTELVEGVDAYQIGDFGANDLARIKQILVNGAPLEEVSWDWMLRRKQLGHDPQKGKVRAYCITPNGVEFLPAPATTTPVVFQYYRQPERLTGNSDRPIIDTYHCGTIVWRAVMDLASNESDSVIFQKATEKYENHLSRMQVEYLPPVTLRAFV